MKRKDILIIVFVISCVIGSITEIYFQNSKVNQGIQEVQNILLKEIVVSKQTEESAKETKEAIEKGENLETTEIIKSSIKEEKEIIEEENLEIDAQVEQENISYNGDIVGKGLKLLGSKAELTYYSQADSRWANKLYTSTNNKTQTMKSSACGPTSAAMIVSSSKGAILPTTMAKLFVDNGYRTSNSGTAWSAYSFVADYFDFKEYYTTNEFNKAVDYLKKGYYIIASCGSGLFTSSGHYIVLAGIDGDKIKVYDPYLYQNKFNTASRKNAKVEVNGNTAYVTTKNFKKYANAKNFWIYSNDSKTVKKETKKETKKTTKKTTPKIKNTVGKTKVFKKATTINSKSNFKGSKYQYLKNTSVKILKNVSTTIDKVKVKATGRIGYVKNNVYK